MRPSGGATPSSAAGLRSTPSTNSRSASSAATLTPATLGRLKAAAVHLKDGSGDAGLDGVLGEIELRVEVELAKMAAA